MLHWLRSYVLAALLATAPVAFAQGEPAGGPEAPASGAQPGFSEPPEPGPAAQPPPEAEPAPAEPVPGEQPPVAAPPAPAEPPPVYSQPASPAPGRAWRLDLGLPFAFIQGHNTYRIEASDPPDSIASELEFPVTGFALGLQAELASRPEPGNGRIVFRGSGLTSIASPSGTMKDSDWFSDSIDIYYYGVAHPGKDIYSESRAELSAFVLDLRAETELSVSRGFVLAPLAGFLYQSFDYDVYDVRQYGYGPYAMDATGSYDGKVLDYKVSHRILYAGARAAIFGGHFSASAELWFSPIASAEDRDDHILREKLSTTSASGTAWQGSLWARLALRDGDFLQAQASLLRVEASGRQHQSFYGGQYAGLSAYIPSTITSSRASYFIVFVHRLAR